MCSCLHVEHTVSCRARLLNRRIPLTNDPRSPRHRLGRFNHVPGSIDIRDIGAHAVINLDAASACDAACANKARQRLDTNSNQNHVAGNARPACSDYCANLTSSAHDLSNFFPRTHIDTIALFFLQHKIRCNRIKRL